MASDQERKERIARWKSKISLTVDENGQLMAGWGYPQDVPHMTNVNEALKKRGINLDEIFEDLEKQGKKPG